MKFLKSCYIILFSFLVSCSLQENSVLLPETTTTTVPETTTTTVPETTTTTVPETTTTTVPETTTTTVPETTTTTVPETTTTTVPETTLPRETLYDFEDCRQFVGSVSSKVSCSTGSYIEKTYEFKTTITNIEKLNEIYIISTKQGHIYVLDPKFESIEMIHNLENKLSFQGEGGFLGLAINQEDNEVVFSYITKENVHIIELFNYEGTLENLKNSKIIFTLQREDYIHYSGTVIWSNYFNDYIVAFGDNKVLDDQIFQNNPLESTVYNGKVVLLNSKNNTDIDYVNIRKLDDEQIKIKSIIAAGMRNPWNIFEFKNYLIIPDVGLNKYEELNIINYKDIPVFLGWPYYEGRIRTEDFYDIEPISKNLVILDSEYKTVKEFLINESVFPSFFYNHCGYLYVCERYAIIGGDINNFVNSQYNFDIFFGDFLTNEIFAYNLIDRNLKILPIYKENQDDENINGLTVVKVFGKDKLIVGADYKVHIIKLP
jgi:hypothetical protein